MKMLLLAGLAALGLSMAAGEARAGSVTLDCDSSNMCAVSISGLSYDTVAWYVDKRSTDARFPYNCTNSTVCEFYCPQKQGIVSVTVNAVSNQSIVGTATVSAVCTAEPI